jgi:phosphonopyruvate decarboxylase
MIACEEFFRALADEGGGFFAGVPDSLLKDFCAYVTDRAPAGQHVIAANEGAALALAAGHHLATGRTGIVYLQNSGLGNLINPLLSLADPEVSAIPVLLVIGWRGEPGGTDEPQHRKQGRVTVAMLGAMEVPWAILPDDWAEARPVVARMLQAARERPGPAALLVRPGVFAPYALRAAQPELGRMSREEAVRMILEQLEGGEIIVATTGLTSREVFEIRAARGSGHARDFLTVGAMGHASQIALGLALEKPARAVWCLDGDGAALMHLGSLAINGPSGARNFRHVILNNAAHDSVGGQPTAGGAVAFPQIAAACSYRWARRVESPEELARAIGELRATEGPALLEIRVKRGARKNLGRPTKSTGENKREFMAYVRG